MLISLLRHVHGLAFGGRAPPVAVLVSPFLPRLSSDGPGHEPAGRENDLDTIELARFAVAEHNSKTVVSGFMYYFTVEAREGGAEKLYEAKVRDEPLWENSKQLEGFQPFMNVAKTA